jgi:hypothetical protein
MQPSSYTITQQEQQQQFGELKPQAEKLVSETAGMGSLVRQDLNRKIKKLYQNY